MTTEIYDTNTDIAIKPKVIATIDDKASTINISNLRVMASFVDKANINTKAVNPIDLILNKEHAILATHPEMKAKSLIDMVKQERSGKHYKIQLVDKNTPYLAISFENDQLKVKILDKRVFHNKTDYHSNKKMARASPEGDVLRALVRQAALDGLESSLDAKQRDGENRSFSLSLTKLMIGDSEKGKFKDIISDIISARHIAPPSRTPLVKAAQINITKSSITTH